MKCISTILIIVAVLFLRSSANAQERSSVKSKKAPYIEVVDCYECNELIISIPSPKYPSNVEYGPNKYNGKVSVQVLIDEHGKVEKAIAVSGHPYFRPLLERESLNATFKPKIVNGKAFKNSGTIVYQIVSRITKRPSITKKAKMPPLCSDCLLPKNAVFVPKPKYPKVARAAGASGEVTVEIVVNNLGNVVYAKAVSGNPMLWAASEQAALRAKFKPAVLSKHPVSVRTRIVYKYVL